MDKQIEKQILEELREIRKELQSLKGIKLNNSESINKPKEKYTGSIVSDLFSKFYYRVEKGLINTKQEDFGRGLYDFYSNQRYLSTKQFDSLSRLVKDVAI
jgi:hypothetical protein